VGKTKNPAPTPKKPATGRRDVERYLAALRPEQQAALATLRARIRSAAPGATESLYYGMPAFRLGGKALVSYLAAKEHCSLFPLSTHTIAAHRAALAGYDTNPGTIRFPAEKPLPAGLVRRLVKARIAELAATGSGHGRAGRTTRTTRTAHRRGRRRGS
jgi:uncharacterized protein YdhG (YjbR/CyaY superfamily)